MFSFGELVPLGKIADWERYGRILFGSKCDINTLQHSLISCLEVLNGHKHTAKVYNSNFLHFEVNTSVALP